MITKKIDILFQILGCNNSDIARYAECSPSEISRLHSGARKHRAESRPVLRFAEGVCAYAEQNGGTEKLYKLLAGSERGNLPAALILWLFDGAEPTIEHTSEDFGKGAQRQRMRLFGNRLVAVMNVLELSNVRLAQKINVDSSTLSRFRSGLRMPAFPISELLVKALLLKARQSEKSAELAKLSGISIERLYRGNEFALWLYCTDEAPALSEINSLLDGISRVVHNTPVPLSDISALVPKVSSDKTAYWGIEGLREAVIRFLLGTAKSGGELLLYSDQDTAWMFGEKSFTAKWAALMQACLQAKVKIRIIHNIDRGIGEMISAIQNWLPLYMTGLIEPYVCRIENDMRFSHTIFLRPNEEAITGFCVSGSENEGWYDYVTDVKRLAALTREFESLIKRSAPLAKVFFEGQQKPASEHGKTLYRLAPAPSIITMPQKLLASILERNAVEEAEKNQVICYYKAQKFQKEQTVYELFPFPSREDLREGKVLLNLPRTLCSVPLYYTEEEFSEHIEAAFKAAESNPGYQTAVLPELPFSDLKITVTEEKVAVTHLNDPFVTFEFFDGRMVRAFSEYMKVFLKQYGKPRDSMRQLFSRDSD